MNGSCGLNRNIVSIMQRSLHEVFRDYISKTIMSVHLWSVWRVAEIAIPKYISLVNWLFWAEASWETADSGRGFSELPFSAWRQILPKELYCHRSLFRAFHQSGKNDTSQEKKLEIHTTHKLSQTIMLPIYSPKDPFVFPKNHFPSKSPILWPPDVKSQLFTKDPDAGKDWRQKEKGPTEDEIDGWHHWLNGHEFEQAPGDREGQGSLVCCSP